MTWGLSIGPRAHPIRYRAPGSKLQASLIIQILQTLLAARARAAVVSDLEVKDDVCLQFGVEFFTGHIDLSWPDLSKVSNWPDAVP